MLKRLPRLSLMLLALLGSLSPPPSLASVAGDEGPSLERYATKRVQPSYPPYAQQHRIEGEVTVQVILNGEGKVSRAEFIRGQNIFRSVSLDAAKRWEFRLPDGYQQGTIHFTFKLSD